MNCAEGDSCYFAARHSGGYNVKWRMNGGKQKDENEMSVERNREDIFPAVTVAAVRNASFVGYSEQWRESLFCASEREST